jgi:hypothetical protein
MGSGEKQGLWATFKGVWAAFLGVQSSKQQEEDFTKGSATQYIVIGLIFVVIFILVVVGVVNIVMSSVGQ